jgi:hypothetical protein
LPLEPLSTSPETWPAPGLRLLPHTGLWLRPMERRGPVYLLPTSQLGSELSAVADSHCLLSSLVLWHSPSLRACQTYGFLFCCPGLHELSPLTLPGTSSGCATCSCPGQYNIERAGNVQGCKGREELRAGERREQRLEVKKQLVTC